MAKRRFHWDVVNDCVTHETDGNGNTLVNYTHEPGAYGPLISENRGGTTSTHHYDALGSTTMLTDDTGAVTDTFQYDAWGNQVSRTGTTPTPYTWVGRWGYQDDSVTTGGYYIRERSYQPTVARWMSVDPIGHSDGFNLYQYSAESPVLAFDPSGLSIIDVVEYFLPILPYIAGGPCGSVDWRIGVEGKIIGSWGAFWKTKQIHKNAVGLRTFPQCPNGSRCCPILDQQIWIGGTLKGKITKIRVRTWIIQATASLELVYRVSEHAIIGVCVRNECDCPQTVLFISNRIIDIDFGTIIYPKQPFPPIEPEWLE